MTLQTSGAISLANVQTEFGGTNPIPMSEYYAGGTRVPAGTTGTNGAVPASGTISMSKFYGTSAIVINLVDDTISDIGSTYAGAAIAFNGAQVTAYGGGTSSYNWITPTSLSSEYQVRATLTGGAITFGSSLNTWLTLTSGTTYRWDVAASTEYYEVQASATLYLEIRKISSGVVVDTATVNLSATAVGIA